MRRIVREFINPTTTTGKYLKPASLLVYYLISKPIDFFYSLSKTEKNFSKNCFYFFYDFEVEPVTYDFAWAVCIANAKREELGLTYLKIIFVPGRVQGLRKEAADYEAIVSSDTRRWRIYAIVLPIIKLLPCPCGITFCMTRDEANLIRKKQARFIYPEKYNATFPVPYSPKQAMQYPSTFSSLKADAKALEYVSEWLKEQAQGKKAIVITLRQYAYTQDRNSNVNAWAQFASALNQEEYFVIFVPDTEQSLLELSETLKDFNFFQPACWNLLLRSALYELAYLNLGVNTGPMSLCWLNSLCRYITFKTITENVPQASLKAMIDKGYIPGKNPSFVGSFQKWVWDEDHFNTIMKEFKLMCTLIEANK